MVEFELGAQPVIGYQQQADMAIVYLSFFGRYNLIFIILVLITTLRRNVVFSFKIMDQWMGGSPFHFYFTFGK